MHLWQSAAAIVARGSDRLVRAFSGRSGRVFPYPLDFSGDARLLYDRWSSTVSHNGLDPVSLLHIYDFVNRSKSFASARCLLIIRGGELIAEGYFRRNKGRRPANVKSVTKSILSLLVGIAIDEGWIADVDARLGDLLPEATAAASDRCKRDIRLRDLLTMQAGLEWDEWALRYKDARKLFQSRDSIGAVLQRPLIDKPGEVFRYSTGTSQIVAGVLKRTTGMSPRDFAESRLFGPLGIERVKWIAARDGIHYGGTHLFLAPRDLAKIGRLCAQNGRWDNRQIVASDWIAQSTQIHAGKDWWEGPYGYHWWVRKQGYCAYGYGGQVLYILPHADLVIVFTADPDRRSHILLKIIEDNIVGPCVSALRIAGDPAAPLSATAK